MFIYVQLSNDIYIYMLHVIMEYLPQHLPLSKITQLWQVNIPYMEHMGYIMEKNQSCSKPPISDY